MNSPSKRSLVALLFLIFPGLIQAAEFEVKQLDSLPDGIPAEFTKALNPQGVAVEGADGAVAQIWLGKALAAKKGFAPSFSIKYPFTTGQFVGVLKVIQKKGYTDFRGQELAPGLYTLRYGLQPEDGNHLGTSTVRDFLLALPIGEDKSPKTLADLDELFAHSSKSAGTTHPAIFAILGLKEAPEKPALEHNEDRDYWMLNTSIEISSDGKPVPFPFQMVVVGYAEG
jgi:hypothetical protein